MKLPKINIISEDLENNVVYFEVDGSRIKGSGFKEHGCNESQYDIAYVEHLNTSNSPLELSIKFSENEIGKAKIIGVVDYVWEDGVFTVESLGFDFWVTPEEYKIGVAKGQWFKVGVTNFIVYI